MAKQVDVVFNAETGQFSSGQAATGQLNAVSLLYDLAQAEGLSDASRGVLMQALLHVTDWWDVRYTRSNIDSVRAEPELQTSRSAGEQSRRVRE